MRAAAFFDMDRTVLTVNSGTEWMRFLWRRGEISRWQLIRSMGWAMQYKLAVLDVETLSRRWVAAMAGDVEKDLIDKHRRWYDEDIARTIAPRARARVNQHRALGDRLVLLTSATPYLADLVAKALGFETVLCTRLEVEGGRFTGRLVEPLCFGRGKVVWAERWAKEADVDLGASVFYTDSFSDLPMLERVGSPIAVNPDPRLVREARRRGWPVHVWDGAA